MPYEHIMWFPVADSSPTSKPKFVITLSVKQAILFSTVGAGNSGSCVSSLIGQFLQMKTQCAYASVIFSLLQFQVTTAVER